MKRIDGNLFNELRSTSASIQIGWLMTRTDGYQLGFTSADKPFTYLGVTYEPTNAFSGTASTSKNNLSVDNMNAVTLISDTITERDLRGGLYDNAAVKVFWISADHPEYGVMPIRGGRFGELNIKNGQFETELRAVMQLLQQPYGDFMTLECYAKLGDSKCKVNLNESAWRPLQNYVARGGYGDAGIGSWCVPTVKNGFWYKVTTIRGQESYVELDASSTGEVGNSANFLTPTVQYQAPASAPLGFQVYTTTVTGARVHAIIGASGATEPVWPTVVGQSVVDGDLTWECDAPRIGYGTVSGYFNRAQFEDDTRLDVTHFWQYGLLTWLSGENIGLSMEVRDYIRDPYGAFTLLEQMPYQISKGDTYKVTIGCPKTRASCIYKFNNIYNMRAFPDMPTEEKALATPNFTQQGTQADPNQGGS